MRVGWLERDLTFLSFVIHDEMIRMKTSPVSSRIEGLSQAWPRPSKPRPIVLIGAGGIANDAHLPAYRKAKFEVGGVFDVDPEKARATAKKFGIPRVFQSLEEAAATRPAVFDVAVPPEHILGILQILPDGAAALIQKPMGRNLEEARRILGLCREKKLVAAVNFQLRFSSMMLSIRDLVQRGVLGEVTDVEVRLNLMTPWEIFPFLKKLDRVEILVHSIHYLDWIRSLLGNPKGVYARTLPDVRYPELKNTRSSIILNYGDTARCCLSINHHYAHGGRHQAAMIKVEGVRGAAFGKLGVMMNYPKGEPDELEIVTGPDHSTFASLEGGWFPDAFIGTMSSLQRVATGEDALLPTRVEDAFQTMALVEACFQSSAQGGTPIPS